MIATITSKGQITLPVSIRRQLRLQPGDQLEFIVRENGHIEVIPLKESPRKLKGMVPKPAKTVTIEEMERAISEGSSL